jgi:hypothetical protein
VQGYYLGGYPFCILVHGCFPQALDAKKPTTGYQKIAAISGNGQAARLQNPILLKTEEDNFGNFKKSEKVNSV